MRFTFILAVFLLAGVLVTTSTASDVAQRFFDQGVAASKAGDAEQAYEMFRESATAQPASGSLHNFANGAWRVGRTGPAVLAWEQSLWLDPRNDNARTSLRYARHSGGLEEPDLRWYEVCSAWLPAGWWPWIAAGSFWCAACLLILPPVFRWKRRDGSQALAAACAAVFLLCLPALAGLNSRAQLGFTLSKDTALRITPTAEAQILTYLSPAEPVRLQRKRGDYALIRTRTSHGWIRLDEVGWVGQRQSW